ncbi:MAG: hypothetical protein HKP55_10940 [Gammaproteobacteria bacterium]|nr:hypothetical protein [Gammaproteobacteria bacterium]
MSHFKKLGLLATVVLLSGCSSTEMLVKVPANADGITVEPYNTNTHKNNIEIFSPLSLQKKINRQQLVQRANNLFVLFDNSASMKEDYRGVSREKYGVMVLDRFHQSLPDINLQGNVYKTNGNIKTSFMSRILSTENNQVNTELAIHRYEPQEMQKRIQDSAGNMIAGDGSLHSAITRISKLITDSRGPAILLLVTRWERIDKKTVIAISRLRQQLILEHERELCVFTVGVGNRYSRARYDQADSCGISVSADKVAQPRDMSHFIERMFFYGPADRDNDGIYDYRDKCPNTEKGRLVRFDGCQRFGTVSPLSNIPRTALAMMGNEK